MCGITAQPPHKEIHKTALGATEAVDWVYEQNTNELVQQLKSDHVQILSIEQAENSTSLQSFLPLEGIKYAVIFGNEVKGVSQEVVNASDHCIEIPQFGTKHSLFQRRNFLYKFNLNNLLFLFQNLFYRSFFFFRYFCFFCPRGES